MICPCKDCPQKGCGSYHDKCESYQLWLADKHEKDQIKRKQQMEDLLFIHNRKPKKWYE